MMSMHKLRNCLIDEKVFKVRVRVKLYKCVNAIQPTVVEEYISTVAYVEASGLLLKLQ